MATTGLSVSVNGTSRVFKGALLAFLADNLASNDLGGFKKSFSFSFRCCRTCLATRDTLSSHYISDNYEMRSTHSHNNQCSMLSGPTTSHFSKTYGINRRSILLDIKFFTMFGGGLPHDAMHDILEGVAPLEVKLLLNHCIQNSLFTLQQYNSRLLNFNFGYSETDKPVPILSRTLHSDNSLRSSASQMLMLVRILPFLVGDKIPEDSDHWLCFLLLRRIIDLILCPIMSNGLCSSLKLAIHEHHTKYVSLYGIGAYIPKMHFILHYPEQIQAIAPMVRTWTIRHEAKLNFFKQASHLVNFKNVSYALANRHQRWMCYELCSEKLVNVSFECGPAATGTGLTTVATEPKDIAENLIQLMPYISLDASVFHPKWVRNNGILYQNNNAYLIIESDGLDPVFGHLDEIIVVGGNMIIFVLSMCKVLYYDNHYHVYAINVTSHRCVYSHLFDHNVYHGHRLANGITYIYLKYYFLS